MNWDSFTPPCMTMPGPVPPAPREASGDGDGTRCGVGQVLGSRAGHQPALLCASPVSLPPMQDQVLLTPPPRYPPWLPAGAPPSPITTVTLQKLRCAKKVRDMPLTPCPRALHPTPSTGSSSMSQEVLPTLICQGGITWIPVGILMRVSSLAGVPGAIPGGGVPGAGFFPGKGIQAVLGGHHPACRDGTGAWGVPGCL